MSSELVLIAKDQKCTMPPMVRTPSGGEIMASKDELIFSGEARLILGRAVHKKEKPIHRQTFDRFVLRGVLKVATIAHPDKRLFNRKDVQALSKRLQTWKNGDPIIIKKSR
jgi:hypothetical protein